MDKLDADTRRNLDAELPPEGLDVAVRVTRETVDTAPEELRQAGFQVYGSLGEVVVGRVADRAALDRLIHLPFVQEVQSSRRLHNEAN